MIRPIQLYQPSQQSGVVLWHVGASPLWSSSSLLRNAAHGKPYNDVRRSPQASHDVHAWSCCVPLGPPWRTGPAGSRWRLAWSRCGSNATANRACKVWGISDLAATAPRAFPPAVAVHLVKLACARPALCGRSLAPWDGTVLRARPLVQSGGTEICLYRLYGTPPSRPS